ncbi:MAG: 50S ribosomal protein L17 [Bacteroidota bacterium]
MRHGLKIKKMGRTAAHRKATLAAMSSALIEHKRIKTTASKAKALRIFVEPIINRAKEDTTHNRRQAFRYLRNKHAVKELFGDIAQKIGDRPGGYTRIIKLGSRAGDATEMAIIELVDYNDVRPDGASSGKKKRTRRSGGRRRRSGGSQQEAAPKQEAQAAEAPEVQPDDLTKVYGIGKVFSGALAANGITTFQQLADADLDTLRGVIASDSDTTDEAANEETWAEQAALLAKGDTEGHASYIEEMKIAAAATKADADEAGDEKADDVA